MNELNNEVLPSVDDLLAGGGSKSLSFKDFKVGDSYTGTISGLRTVQVRNYDDPTKLEFWDDGKPKLQIEVTLDTDYKDPTDDEDTGERRVFLFGQKLTAAKEELKRKGMSKLEIGSEFKITLTGTKPAKNPRYNDVKLYGIELKASTSNPAVDALLSSGAKEVKSAKIEALDAKQTKVAETLQSNGFTAAEIAEQLGVSTSAVESVLTF
jgi:hypothetical protein